MAQILYSHKLETGLPLIGKQLLDVITSGMYDNPLMIYREYIQNAVDSIDIASEKGMMSIENGNIMICLNGEKREITIEDNGAGLSSESAPRVLSSLGMSPKEGQQFRGFRGIGRLGGLAYCDELIFETRAKSAEQVTQVRWDRRAFDNLTTDKEKLSLESAIDKISDVKFIRPTENDPPHFFRVSLKGVRKFHNDLLMNVKAASNYISQVAPVSYNRDAFKFADDIHNYFSIMSDYRCYDISLNGKTLYRPYVSDFAVSQNRIDTIHSVEYFSFVDAGGDRLALGWYAKTDFLASLPPHVSMRGIRIRQGNIEIGDEHFLNDMYTETRFAGWTIGEIHICDNKLKPNARRDNFEVSANYEKFLEQSEVLGRRLSGLCRRASNERIQRERIERELGELDKHLNQSSTHIDMSDIIASRRGIEKKITDISAIAIKFSHNNDYQPALEELRIRSDAFFESAKTIDSMIDGRKLSNLSQKEVLKRVVAIVAKKFSCCGSQQELVAHILGQFAKTGRK